MRCARGMGGEALTRIDVSVLEPLGRDWDDLHRAAWQASLDACENTEEVAAVVAAGILMELLYVWVKPRPRRRWFTRLRRRSS